jgi:hypothetical protein
MKKRLFLIMLIVVSFYVAVAFTVYRFKHPELTETELILHSKEALTWQP